MSITPCTQSLDSNAAIAAGYIRQVDLNALKNGIHKSTARKLQPILMCTSQHRKGQKKTECYWFLWHYIVPYVYHGIVPKWKYTCTHENYSDAATATAAALCIVPMSFLYITVHTDTQAHTPLDPCSKCNVAAHNEIGACDLSRVQCVAFIWRVFCFAIFIGVLLNSLRYEMNLCSRIFFLSVMFNCVDLETLLIVRFVERTATRIWIH